MNTQLQGILVPDSFQTGDGVVTYVDANTIIVNEAEGDKKYELTKFRRSNAGTCLNHSPIVENRRKG